MLAHGHIAVALNDITEPALRAELIAYANGAGAGVFTPTAAEVAKLNAIVATLPHNLPNATLWDNAVNTAFAGNANAPGATLITTGGNFANIDTQHARLRPLYAIAEPTLRKALFEFATTAPNTFSPSDAEISQLNTTIAGIAPGAFNQGALGNAVHGAFNVLNNPPAATHFNAAWGLGMVAPGAGHGHLANITLEHNRLHPLYPILNNVTEPALRRALIDYAITNPAFNPQPADVVKLNADIAALPANATAADFGRVVNSAFPAGAPGGNYFVPASPGEFAFIGIAAEHTRLAPLYKINEPALRAALIDFALNPPANFEPSDAEVFHLNTLVAALPHNATAVQFDGALQTAFAANANAPGAGPAAFFAAGGPAVAVNAFAGITLEHANIFALSSVTEPALRKALINFATQPGANFIPQIVDVVNLNNQVAAIAPDANAAANLDLAIQAAFAGVANRPGALYFGVGGPAAAAFTAPDTGIGAEHTRLAPLYKITEPALREALLAYAEAKPGFNPIDAEVTRLNNDVADLPDIATHNDFSVAVNAAFNVANDRPTNTYFNPGQPGNAVFTRVLTGIDIEHNRLAPLYKVTEPLLRKALIDFALSIAPPGNFQPTHEEVFRLNTLVAGLPHNATDAQFDGALQTAFAGGINPPGAGPAAFFAGGGSPAAIAAFAGIAAEHNNIFALGSITEPALRKALVDFAKANAGFNPQPADVLKLNAAIADLGPTATAADFSQEVNRVFGRTGPANDYFNNAALGAPGPVAFNAPATGIAAEHARLAPLYKIDSPALRQALLDFAIIPPANFSPTIAQVSALNDAVADLLPNVLPHPVVAPNLNALRFDTAVRAAFNALGANPPGPNYFQNDPIGTAAFVGIAAQHDNTVPLYKITEPTLRKALIDFAVANPTFAPAYADIVVLNAAVANLPPDANADDFSATVHTTFALVAHPPGPANNHFKAGGAGHTAFTRISDEHARIAPLLTITEPALRQALVDYAVKVGTFNPTDDQVADLNTRIAALPQGPGPGAAALDFDREVTNAFRGATNPPRNDYFQNDPDGIGQVAFAKINNEHPRIAPLLAIRESVLRAALIDFATTPPGNSPATLFVPTAGAVQNLNTAVAGLDPGPGTAAVPGLNRPITAGDFDGAVQAAFNAAGVLHLPNATFFQNDIDGRAAFNQIKGDHPYTMVMTDLETKNAAPATFGEFDNLIALLKSPANKSKVISKLASLPGVSAPGLFNDLRIASSETAAKLALKNLGLETLSAPVIKEIVDENKRRHVNMAKRKAVPFGAAATDPNRQDIINTHNRFADFKTLLDNINHETKKATAGRPDPLDINEKDERTYKLKIKLTKYRNTLLDKINNPARPANINPLTISTSKANEILRELDRYLGPLPPPPVPGAPPVPPPAPSGVIADIEANLAVIATNRAPALPGVAAPPPKRMAYYQTRITPEPAHTRKGDGSLLTYAEATQEVTTYLGAPNLAGPAAMLRAGGGGHYKTTEDVQISWVPINVEGKTKVRGGEHVQIPTAMVREQNPTSAKAELFATDGDWQKLANVWRERSIRTSIPGIPVMQWAMATIDSFVAIKPPDEPIEINTFSLPKELTEALVIACKFRGLKYDTYYGVDDKVTDAQVRLFAERWSKIDKKDVGVEQEETLLKSTRLKL